MDIKFPLYPYQEETKNFMLKGSCINASFCGSGKTITTIAAITELGHEKNLIICPKSVLLNWAKEINMWLGSSAAVFVANGSPKARKAVYEAFFALQGKPKYLILTYDTLRLSADPLKPVLWDAVVMDEVHYCVNIKSIRFKACAALKAKVKYGLTATPIMNQATDIYGCVTAVKGFVLGNYFKFLDRYCVKDSVWGYVKAYKNMGELALRVKPYIIRKTLDDAQFQLPDLTETDLEFELSEPEALLYDKIRKELLFEFNQSEISKLSSPVILQNTLVKLGKLQELADSCELIGESSQSTKLETLKEHLSNHLYEGQKAIIFTRFERMAKIIQSSLGQFKPCLLTGAVSNRQELIDQFTNDPTRKIFISTEAGGAGINLQAANIVYNYDLPFSLGKLEQRNGRIRYHLQDRPCFFYNLLARVNGKRSIDHFVKDKIIKKQEISEKVLLSDIKEILT